MPKTAIKPFVLPFVLALAAGLGACASEPTIAFRIASTSPTADRHPMKLVAQDSTFYVADSIVISDNELADVRVARSDPFLVLRIQLTGEGQSRLGAATSSHIGERLALVIDSRLLAAPLIVEGVAGRDLTAGFKAPKDVEDEIAAIVEKRWPHS